MPSPSILRTAVIGLGRMGRHHARACAESIDLELTGLYDSEVDILHAHAAELGCPAFDSAAEFIGKIDMAVIAVPTQLHATVAIPLLHAGIACLIEKPIAVAESDAHAIAQAAAEGGAIVRVGHIERFNPAITALRRALPENGTPLEIVAERCNPAQDRLYDTDAVLDLMIHDIDLVQFLRLIDFESYTGEVVVRRPASYHAVHAAISMADGTNVTLEASREASTPRRSLTVVYADAVYSVDFLTRRVTVNQTGKETVLPIDESDALRTQLRSFTAAVRGEDSDTADNIAASSALRFANVIRGEADQNA
jgi:predicted dehydrogenase